MNTGDQKLKINLNCCSLRLGEKLEKQMASQPFPENKEIHQRRG